MHLKDIDFKMCLRTKMNFLQQFVDKF